jgi:hypothetical protein
MIAVLPLVLAAAIVGCPPIERSGTIPGRLVVTFASANNSTAPVACVLDEQTLTPAPRVGDGELQAAYWGRSKDDLLLSTCSSGGLAPTCRLEHVALDGRVLGTYPAAAVASMEEPDGRRNAGGITGPASVSANGQWLAADGYGHSPAVLLMRDGSYVAGLSGEHSSFAWGPSGAAIAYTRSPDPNHSALQESQLFVYDVDTRDERQLTNFLPSKSKPWWNPFADPVLTNPIVAGVSWARRANLIGFYLAQQGEAFVWTPDGKPVGRPIRPRGRCWRGTRLSADAQTLLYLSSTDAGLCLRNAGNEVRIANTDGTSDRVLLSVHGDDAITNVDWWSE